MNHLSRSTAGTWLATCICADCVEYVVDSLPKARWRVVEVECDDATDKESLIDLALKAFGCDVSTTPVTSWDVALDLLWQSVAFEERRVAILCKGFDDFIARNVQLAFDWLEVLHSLNESVSTDYGGNVVLLRVVLFGEAYPGVSP